MNYINNLIQNILILDTKFTTNLFFLMKLNPKDFIQVASTSYTIFIHVYINIQY